MFYIGQKVVCVREKQGPDPAGIPCPLVYGAIYTVTGLPEKAPHENGPSLGMTILEVDPPHPYRGFDRSFFRPAAEHKTDISIFTKMLNPELV